MKAESLDAPDRSVLVYKRQDLSTKPGFGYMWGAINGSLPNPPYDNAPNTNYMDSDWPKVKVQLGEFNGGHKILVQRREDTGADIWNIGDLIVNFASADWHLQKKNCIRFDGAENTECVKIPKVWYRNVPNQPGPPPVSNPDNWRWLRILAWILGSLILLGALAYLIYLFTASQKPGLGRSQSDYYATKRGGKRVVEETVVERGSRSTTRGLNYEDVEEIQYESGPGLSQEEVYGDYSSMPYRESTVVYN